MISVRDCITGETGFYSVVCLPYGRSVACCKPISAQSAIQCFFFQFTVYCHFLKVSSVSYETEENRA